jgi:PAS domain S-box-containing protein
MTDTFRKDLDIREKLLEERLVAVGQREKQVQGILSSINQGIIVSSRDGIVISYNPAAERILGVAYDQANGRITMDDRWMTVRSDGSPMPQDEQPAAVTLRTGKPVRGQIMGLGDGLTPRRWLLVESDVMEMDPDGLPASVVTTFVDITEMRLADEERRRKEGRIQGFFNLSLDLICICTSDGRFLHLNGAWTRILGWSEAELLARPFIDLVHPDDRESTMREAGKVASGGSTVGYENRYGHRDGSWRHFYWTAIRGMEPGSILAVAHDVTDLRFIPTPTKAM